MDNGEIYKAPSGRELASVARLKERAVTQRSLKPYVTQAPSVFCFAKSTSLPEGGSDDCISIYYLINASPSILAMTLSLY